MIRSIQLGRLARRRSRIVHSAASPTRGRSNPSCTQTTIQTPIRQDAAVRFAHTASIHLNSSLSRSFTTSTANSIPSSAARLRLPPIPLFQHFTSTDFLARTAIGHVTGESSSTKGAWTYHDLLTSARSVCALLQHRLGDPDLADRSVAFLYTGSFEYVTTLFGIWMAGGIAVPLHQAHARPELEYLLHDSQAAILLVSSELKTTIADKLQLPKTCQAGVVEWSATSKSTTVEPASNQELSVKPISYGTEQDFLNRRAMLIYTSGTTGKVT